jgi:CheY-like chemotaxis protein
MKAVGSLAGGVAHDFNNVIAVITSVTELMLEDPTLRPEQRADLGDVRQAASRAADLTRKLLAFSRSQALQQRVLDLDEVIADTEKLLRRLVREDIALATSLGAGGARVFADAGQLEQVLLNLVVNACDAMPRGGRLGVETSQVELDREVAARQAGARAGKYVLLSVTDTGSGMAPDVLARAFEPFFTTKAPGKGTGLGLAIVYGVVQQSGGFVRLSSEPGAGTTASVFLPRYEGGGVAAPRLERSGAERGGAETLLVVEDEPAVRAVCRRILEARGYTVLLAANGAEALDLARGRDVDLLVTDLVMPCVGGSELAATLRAERPSLPAIFMSGYAGEAGTLPADVPLLRKPFTPDALARAVRAALDGAAPTT